MIVTNDYKFRSNIDEVIRSGFLGVFFTIRFHKYKIA